MRPSRGCVVPANGSMARAMLAVALLFAVLAPGWAQAQSLTARAFKMAGDATHIRIVVQFDKEPEARWFLLRAPHRLVVDLPETKFVFNPKDLRALGLVKSVSYGAVGQGGSRLILATKGPFSIEHADVMANEDGNGYRLALDIGAASTREFEAALAEQVLSNGSTSSTPKGDRVVQQPAPAGSKPFTLVIDAGHGGIGRRRGRRETAPWRRM